jgi:hypothetical protein
VLFSSTKKNKNAPQSQSQLTPKNKIDSKLKKAQGEIPSSIKVYFALSIPKPVGAILYYNVSPVKPWSWGEHTEEQWRNEFKKNCGPFITAFLRINTFSNNKQFMQLFEHIEIRYQEELKKLGWVAKYSKKPEKQLKKILIKLSNELVELQNNFVEWCVENRNSIHTELEIILSKNEYRHGSVSDDLHRWMPSWFIE